MSEIADLVQQARTLGNTPQAAQTWLRALHYTTVDETDYSDWVRELIRVYQAVQRPLSAARLYEYLMKFPDALAAYSKFGNGRDQGRILRLGRQFSEAAQRYRESGMLAHAARCLEEQENRSEALACYEQLLRAKEAANARYLAGLAALAAGRIAAQLGHGDKRTQLLGQAVRFLEEEADNREQHNDRDGALRCYTSLIHIGKLEGSYEQLAEGFLNCIRLLKAKSDRFFTIQYYADFIAHAEELGEWHAVAELYREGGEYARRIGFIYADGFLTEAGYAWMHLAKASQEKNSPAELVENALLGAVGCFNRIGDDENLLMTYKMLADLPISDVKKEKYQELVQDLQGERWQHSKSAPPIEGQRQGLPEQFKRRLNLQPYWQQDLLEAEASTDISDSVGRLVSDPKTWEVHRRKALLIMLTYDEECLSQFGKSSRLERSEVVVSLPLIEKLCDLGHSAAVKPLLAIYEKSDENIRASIVEKSGQLKQKESFALIDKAIAALSQRLRAAGIVAINRMNFPQALDSLVRLYGSYDNLDVRDACMRSIAQVGTDEACEFLLDVMRSNTGDLSRKARQLLEDNAKERMLSALERNRRREPDANMRMFLSRLIERIRQQRGAAAY